MSTTVCVNINLGVCPSPRGRGHKGNWPAIVCLCTYDTGGGEVVKQHQGCPPSPTCCGSLYCDQNGQFVTMSGSYFFPKLATCT